MRLCNITDVTNRHGERRRVVLSEDRSESEMVRAFVKILCFQSQLVAAKDDGGMNMDDVESRLLFGKLFSCLESENFGGAIGDLWDVFVGGRDRIDTIIRSEDVVFVGLADHGSHWDQCRRGACNNDALDCPGFTCRVEDSHCSLNGRLDDNSLKIVFASNVWRRNGRSDVKYISHALRG